MGIVAKMCVEKTYFREIMHFNSYFHLKLVDFYYANYSKITFILVIFLIIGYRILSTAVHIQ